MRKVVTSCAVVTIILAVSGVVSAVPLVSLNVDSAPNIYYSPAWGPWWSQAKDDVAAGSFTDMGTGTHPGTHTADPYDEIVYSTLDFGKRLHWIYWLPGKTVAGLEGLFEAKWSTDWDGDDRTDGWVADGPEVGWSQPSNWEDYDDGQGTTGVIGSFGFAWLSTDDEAPPFDTGGSAYDEVDQADIDALRADVLLSQTYVLGQVRYRETINDSWQYTSLNVNIVPEPATICLLGLGGLGLLRRRKRT